MHKVADAQLDARYLELARLRAHNERLEAAVGRVLTLCDEAGKVTSSERAHVLVSEVRSAIGPRP